MERNALTLLAPALWLYDNESNYKCLCTSDIWCRIRINVTCRLNLLTSKHNFHPEHE